LLGLSVHIIVITSYRSYKKICENSPFLQFQLQILKIMMEQFENRIHIHKKKLGNESCFGVQKRSFF